MTENVFYPVFLWLALALVAALERPTLVRQLLLLAACALAFVTRAQTVAIVAAVLTAPVVARVDRARPAAAAHGVRSAVRDRRRRSGRSSIVVEVARGQSPAAILGNYSVTSNGGYHVWPAIEWIVLHLAELDLARLRAPVRGAHRARRERAPPRPQRCACTPLRRRRSSCGSTLEVGVFASKLLAAHRGAEPLLSHAAASSSRCIAWIERGQPLPPRASVAAAGIAAALPGAIPFAHLFNITAAVRHDRAPAVVVRRRHVDRAGTASASSRCCSPSRSPRCFLWLPRAVRAAAARARRARASSARGSRSSCGRTASRGSRRAHTHRAIGTKDKSWIDARRRSQRRTSASSSPGGNNLSRARERVLEPQHRPRVRARRAAARATCRRSRRASTRRRARSAGSPSGTSSRRARCSSSARGSRPTPRSNSCSIASRSRRASRRASSASSRPRRASKRGRAATSAGSARSARAGRSA